MQTNKTFLVWTNRLKTSQTFPVRYKTKQTNGQATVSDYC